VGNALFQQLRRQARYAEVHDALDARNGWKVPVNINILKRAGGRETLRGPHPAGVDWTDSTWAKLAEKNAGVLYLAAASQETFDSALVDNLCSLAGKGWLVALHPALFEPLHDESRRAQALRALQYVDILIARPSTLQLLLSSQDDPDAPTGASQSAIELVARRRIDFGKQGFPPVILVPQGVVQRVLQAEIVVPEAMPKQVFSLQLPLDHDEREALAFQAMGLRSAFIATFLLNLCREAKASLRRGSADVLDTLVKSLRSAGIDVQKPFRTGSPTGQRDSVRSYGLVELQESNDLGMVGISEQAGVLRNEIRKAAGVACNKTPILVTGESGTGKQLVAMAIHSCLEDMGRTGKFVEVNCALLQKETAESALFGHAVGAYTGAVTSTVGFFQEADRGTLFLDEIGKLSLDVQGMLLKVVDDGKVRPLGGSMVCPVNVIVVAATNRDLNQALRDGTFHSDLFSRLAVNSVAVPPLRERAEDIEPLIWHFADQFAERHNQEPAARSFRGRLLGEVLTVFREHHWSGGNCRDVIAALIYLFKQHLISPQRSPFTEADARQAIRQCDTQTQARVNTVEDPDRMSPTRSAQSYEREQIPADIIEPLLGKIHGTLDISQQRRQEATGRLLAVMGRYGTSSGCLSIGELTSIRGITRHFVQQLQRAGILTTQGRGGGAVKRLNPQVVAPLQEYLGSNRPSPTTPGFAGDD
jgi:DNA-binding NtrC family response regulator